GKNRIYDRSDFGGVIERVTLDHESLIFTETEEPCMELGLTINLDPFRNQQNTTSYDRLDSKVKLSSGAFYERKDTGLKDSCFIVCKNGLRLIVWYDKKSNRIILSNNLSL